MKPNSIDANIAFATSCSRYLQRILSANPHLRPILAANLPGPLTSEAMLALLPASLTEDSIKPALRQLRMQVMAHLICRDLGGMASLEEVTQTMTSLAEIAVTTALSVHESALANRHGTPRNTLGEAQSFICIGMGKLGGCELNVSSDVDFIFVYPEDGETDAGQPNSPATGQLLSNCEFFTRLGRRLIDSLSELTGDGFVFRVDMRLRPNGDSGPLVASFDMLETYFISQGREWERYAWIKARPMSGHQHEALEAIRRPFVFRKYLDYGAINAMRELHAQIRREVSRKDMADHIKLGPGGIREIEFIAQVFQLIRGGRDTGLQIRPTLSVLQQLATRKLLSQSSVQSLDTAYRFLRKLEHRLQYIDDAQTHRLPTNLADQAIIAATMGFASYEALLEELDSHRLVVSQHFDAVFGDPTRQGHAHAPLWQNIEDTPFAEATLRNLGYADAAQATQHLQALQRGTRYQHLAPSIRHRFDALVPQVIEAAARKARPDATLQRTLSLLETISRRAAYLALLQQYPVALQRLCDMTGASSWAASYLTRHPILLDELLDESLLHSAPDWQTFEHELRSQLDALEPDTERQMDVLREQHHTQVFRLLAQDLAGSLSVETLADHLTRLADILLQATLEACWRKLNRRHTDTPNFAVIAYGKLGSKELGYASDLDIVFIYEDDHPDAGETYARLAQRVLTWLSAQTSAGQLFETDTRLRPNGESGLLVSSFDAFAEYQQQRAWLWEHQALTRARICAQLANPSGASTPIETRFESLRSRILTRKRDWQMLCCDVLDMRNKMHEAHPAHAGSFDLKQDSGGLIDVEFIVQTLILGHAQAQPQLTGNLGNIALLRLAGEVQLIPAELALACGNAYRELRRLQHQLRLNEESLRVPNDTLAIEQNAVRQLWHLLFGAINQTQKQD